MKFTIDWLKDHLDTKLNDEKIIDKLTNVGLEVESFQSQPSELDNFIIAKIISSEKHPNADRLKVCEVDIGKNENVKVVCGAPNAKKNLITVYAPPGAIIPKNQMKLSVSKIRGVTSYGMLCSEAELKLSDESQGITELSGNKYESKIGKSSKVNHLSYVGDSKLGKNVNIGAGTITCNYDGIKKSKTIIKNNVFIGSNSSLVAPLTIDEKSVVGAGSVITKKVNKKSLALTRSNQIEIKNYKRKK